jgi:hypothetical protein
VADVRAPWFRPSVPGWTLAAAALSLLLFWGVARYYHPQYGFTGLILFNAGAHDREIAVLQGLPHYEYVGDAAYDGAFYAQLALDPLLKDPAIDVALDNPPYRARRILFSWTAFALGLGRPAWILQAYALQNLLSWVLLGVLMTRWLPLTSGRGFALWSAVMFSHGLLVSIRFAVLDGPSMLLLALAIAASERGRTWLSAALAGIATLGRETNMLVAAALPLPQGWRGWLRLAAAGLLVLGPLLVWQDYLWSIYRGTSAAEGLGHITPPLQAYLHKWRVTLAGLGDTGLAGAPFSGFCTTAALTVQLLYLGISRRWREPWWRLAAAFGVLMLVVNDAVWEGYPGAATRVLLPLTFGFNVLLAQEGRGFWWWFVAGNLHLLPARAILPFPWLPPPY